VFSIVQNMSVFRNDLILAKFFNTRSFGTAGN